MPSPASAHGLRRVRALAHFVVGASAYSLPSSVSVTTDNATMAQQPPPFSRLAREIRDEIYRLAYPPNSRWLCPQPHVQVLKTFRTLRRAIGGYRPEPTSSPPVPCIPECPLNAMIVNKQYYSEAAQVYFETTALVDEDREKGVSTELFALVPSLQTRVIKFSGDWRSMDEREGRPVLPEMPNLKRLTLYIDDDTFDTVTHKHICIDEFNGSDFAHFQDVKELLRFPSLQKVELTAGYCSMAIIPEEEKIWARNIAVLETYINERLQQRNSTGAAASHRSLRQACQYDIQEEEGSQSKHLDSLKSQALDISEQMAALTKKFSALQEGIKDVEARIKTEARDV
ncbi:uncharacterized protein CLAFUR5_11767 [Fulvia fulva]|uniref:Uncharacterized protein n=1 Tax=Passalora fulva TaxID=5499 RepID=A0A9Q8PHA5_PASFU|nr:uncharacterized protein CLAFUR5_11767 [Fulvia fulva]KAK4627481.1 hypothetical protein CLAFUR0_05130 [Fulvia fulva]UJO22453.1 hypothetical protein CLAFUR5_11767 [Fulvia fulva]WPV29080.1 hypothetical protein CLAFUW7_05134 [Fulvia fulva]